MYEDDDEEREISDGALDFIISMHTAVAESGETLTDSYESTMLTCRYGGTTFTCAYGGIKIVCAPSDSIEDVIARYWTECRIRLVHALTRFRPARQA